MKTALIDPPTSMEYRGGTYPWEMLPPKLQKRLSPKSPVYLLEHDAVVRWDDRLWEVKAGYYWDSASIPLSLRVIGLSRWSERNELFPASLYHDAGWRGTLPRLGRGRKNLLRYNRMYADLAVAAGYPPWKMFVQKFVLDLKVWIVGAPKKYADQPDPTLVDVRPADPQLSHRYPLDWLRDTTGSA